MSTLGIPGLLLWEGPPGPRRATADRKGPGGPALGGATGLAGISYPCCFGRRVPRPSPNPRDPVRFVNHEYVTTEDLSVNEIESISEWVLEHVFKIPNAVPETDDSDSVPIVKHLVDYYFVNNHFLAAIIPATFSVSFKAVHLFVISFWSCDAVFDLIKPPKH